MLLFLQEEKEEDCPAPQVTSASQESSGPRLHLQLLPFFIGRDSSVGEGGDPNQKEENRGPQKEPVWAARARGGVSGHRRLPKALSRSQSGGPSTACPCGCLVDSPSYCLQ